MSNYYDLVNDAMEPHSKGEDYGQVLQEWVPTGEVRDTDFEGACELCSHTPLRWQYQIESTKTSSTLWIGSRCLQNIYGETAKLEGRDEEQARKEARSEIREAKKTYGKHKILEALRSLWKLENSDFQGTIWSIADDLKERGHVTPKQAKLLDWRCSTHDIDFPMEFLSIDLRKDKYKEQLQQMEDWKVAEIWQALDSKQRRRARERGWVKTP